MLEFYIKYSTFQQSTSCSYKGISFVILYESRHCNRKLIRCFSNRCLITSERPTLPYSFYLFTTMLHFFLFFGCFVTAIKHSLTADAPTPLISIKCESWRIGADYGGKLQLQDLDINVFLEIWLRMTSNAFVDNPL